MIPEINQVAISGQVSTAPETRTTQAGILCLSFTLAAKRSYRDSAGEVQQLATSIPIALWDKLAECFSMRLHKGCAVFITGKLQLKAQPVENTASPTLEVVARNIQILPDNSTNPSA